jgi:uncharacterized protein YqeY
MALKLTLRDALKDSMKKRDGVRTETVRSLLSAIQYLEMEKSVEELSAEESVGVVQREAKKRREEIEFAEKAGRGETVSSLERELAIIEEFLPKQLSRPEIVAILTELSAGLSSKNLGELMKLLKERHAGCYEGKMASEVAREVLGL